MSTSADARGATARGTTRDGWRSVHCVIQDPSRSEHPGECTSDSTDAPGRPSPALGGASDLCRHKVDARARCGCEPRMPYTCRHDRGDALGDAVRVTLFGYAVASHDPDWSAAWITRLTSRLRRLSIARAGRLAPACAMVMPVRPLCGTLPRRSPSGLRSAVTRCWTKPDLSSYHSTALVLPLS